MGHSVVRLPRSAPKNAQKTHFDLHCVSQGRMNQLAFRKLRSAQQARPQNNMLEYLVIQEFARVVESMPTDEREHIVREVLSQFYLRCLLS